MNLELSSLIIRECLDTDVAAITAIYARHVLHGTASFEIDPPLLQEMQRRRADILCKDLPYLVAQQEDDVVGYAYAGTYRPRAAYRDTAENSVYIRHDMAGRGIGLRLLDSLIQACESRDLRQMIAVIGDSANIASIRLHARCGFQHVGVLRDVGYKHGKWLDSVLMQRSLGKGNDAPPNQRAS